MGAQVCPPEGAVKLFPLTLVMGLMCGCATAVTTSSEEGNDAGATQTKDSGTTATKDSGTPKVYDAGGTTNDSGSTSEDSGTIDDTTCASQSTLAQCEQCCLTVHPEGYQVYNTALTSCACQSPGACASECASEACVNQPTTQGDACDTCMTGALASDGACYGAVSTACQGDSDCTELFSTCIPPCENLQ